MAPDDRRREILDAARHLFSERPYRTVSTKEIADEAGVARSLLHHYFGGIREVFLAVVADNAAALLEARDAGPEMPFEERTAHNVKAGLDVIAANRETWLAIVGHGADAGDPEIHAMVNAGKARGAERTLRANSDLIEDTPAARFALRCFSELTVTAIRAWLSGERTREETETLLLAAGRTFILHTIPAIEGRDRDAAP